MAESILIADDQANIRKILKAILSQEGYSVEDAADGHEVISKMSSREFSVVVTDLKMPGLDGLQVLERLAIRFPRIPVIVITAHGTVETAVDAMKKGAFDYITKPFERDEIVAAVRKAVATFNLSKNEVAFGADVTGHYRSIIGQSPQMQEIYKLIEKVAGSPTTILILGESGTGKELIAKAIHDSSPLRDKPFIKINCAAIPENLLESELFGYEKGAFTGAVTTKPGRFELADGGTLFLDEIGDIPREMQVKLLRCLQEQEFERVGGLKTIKVNVRLLAATNKDLSAAVENGSFRRDLFYRLNVVPIHMPALRHRTEDISLLIRHFIEKFNERLKKQITGIDADAEAILLGYQWPGNIRELENIMERAMLLCDGPIIKRSDLPLNVSGEEHHKFPAAGPVDTELSLKDAVKRQTQHVERALIRSVLKEMNGNITHAAKKLGISRKSLQMKVKEYSLRDDEL